jgi:REP element-mobilizing transposase RayT
MPNTFTQIHIQYVFAVKYRAAVLDPAWDERLRQYITGIYQELGHKMLAINNMPDHIHIFGGLGTHQCISDVMEVVKSQSSKWINDNRFTIRKFQWQSGYGAFSYSKWDVNKIIDYVKNQQEHHNNISFHEEINALIEEQGIVLDEKYRFHHLLD